MQKQGNDGGAGLGDFPSATFQIVSTVNTQGVLRSTSYAHGGSVATRTASGGLTFTYFYTPL